MESENNYLSGIIDFFWILLFFIFVIFLNDMEFP